MILAKICHSNTRKRQGVTVRMLSQVAVGAVKKRSWLSMRRAKTPNQPQPAAPATPAEASAPSNTPRLTLKEVTPPRLTRYLAASPSMTPPRLARYLAASPSMTPPRLAASPARPH